MLADTDDLSIELTFYAETQRISELLMRKN